MDDWSEKEVAFFGKITAGITHEMKNVLAIIKESSGLMEDFLSLSPEALLSYQEKLKNSLVKIKDQIQRGVALTDRLNKFAHSSDEPIAEIDLFEIVEQIVALSSRFARLKNVDLQAVLPQQSSQPPVLQTQPVRLQMVLFAAIECCLEAVPAGGVISIAHHEKNEHIAVKLSCEGDFSGRAEFIDTLRECEKWAVVHAIAASLKGSAETDESAPGMVLFLPQKMNR